MVVDYLSPITGTLLAYYFAPNTAFAFSKPFYTAGVVVGSATFVANLQNLLLMNLFAQIGPEIVCDFACIIAERNWGFGKLADQYWERVFSFAGLLRYGPGFVLVVMSNLAIILLTGKTACTEGQCVQGL